MIVPVLITAGVLGLLYASRQSDSERAKTRDLVDAMPFGDMNQALGEGEYLRFITSDPGRDHMRMEIVQTQGVTMSGVDVSVGNVLAVINDPRFPTAQRIGIVVPRGRILRIVGKT